MEAVKSYENNKRKMRGGRDKSKQFNVKVHLILCTLCPHVLISVWMELQMGRMALALLTRVVKCPKETIKLSFADDSTPTKAKPKNKTD